MKYFPEASIMMHHCHVVVGTVCTTRRPLNHNFFPINNNPVSHSQPNPIQPKLGPFVPALTLEGIRVAGDEVLELIAVGLNVVKGFSSYSQLVALLHLPGAARRTLVLTNQQIHI